MQDQAILKEKLAAEMEEKNKKAAAREEREKKAIENKMSN